jgi:hypothetical protein
MDLSTVGLLTGSVFGIAAVAPFLVSMLRSGLKSKR